MEPSNVGIEYHKDFFLLGSNHLIESYSYLDEKSGQSVVCENHQQRFSLVARCHANENEGDVTWWSWQQPPLRPGHRAAEHKV